MNQSKSMSFAAPGVLVLGREMRMLRLWLIGLLSQCEQCGSTYILQVHHVNGDVADARLENLQLLCRKCHGTFHVLKYARQRRERKPQTYASPMS